MKCARFHGRRDVRIDEIEEPACRRGFVKIRIAWCGICGSDIAEFRRGPSSCPQVPHPVTGDTIPVVLGHEFSGTIVEVGEEVTGLHVGQRVCIDPTISDNTCELCKCGQHNLCQVVGCLGYSGWSGGFSQLAIAPAYNVYSLPDSISLEVGALIEPLAVAWHAIAASPFRKGDTALIVGGGPIGLAVLQCLKAMGSGAVIVSELAEMRRQTALRFGADRIVDPREEDTVEACQQITEGRGVDISVDCAGVQAAFDQGIAALRPRGTFINVAWVDGEVTIKPILFMMKEKRYQSSILYERGDFQHVIDAIVDGRIEPEAMITKKIAVEDLVVEGLEALLADRGSHVKILAGQGA